MITKVARSRLTCGPFMETKTSKVR